MYYSSKIHFCYVYMYIYIYIHVHVIMLNANLKGLLLFKRDPTFVKEWIKDIRRLEMICNSYSLNHKHNII